MSAKQRLNKKDCKDYTLLSNLDFSEYAFRHNPLNQVMTLQVKGQWEVVKIGKVGDVIYTVSSEDGQPRFDCCVYCDSEVIMDADVRGIHYSVHSCQNQSRSCFTEAKDAVKSKPKALKITCNRFSVTYVTRAVPDEIKTVETKCLFVLPQVTAQGLLETKCWMEKEKKNCGELISCLNHLIEIYLLTSEAAKNNCRFILHGNNELAEIVSYVPNKLPNTQYIVKADRFSKVSMYPPLGSST